MNITQLTIKPNWVDITTGEKGKPTRCAIAKAIYREYPWAKFVRVTETKITLTDSRSDLRYEWSSPLTARKAIKAFDHGKTDVMEELPPFHLRGDEAIVTRVHRRQGPDAEAHREHDRARRARLNQRTTAELRAAKETAQRRTRKERSGK